MAIYQTEFFGNTTLGLLGVATENVCYLPTEITRKQIKRIAETLNVVVKKASFYNSSLLGLFSVANSKYLFVPDIVSDVELEFVDKKVIKLTGVFTTLGNLILCNDKGCILSPYLAEKKYFFENELKLKTEITTISDLPFPGIFATVTNRAGIVHKNCKDAEIEILEKQEINLKEVANNGAQLILKMVFECGVFHADPHPGNIFVLPGNVLAPVDFGMVGRIDEEMKECLVNILRGIVDKDTHRISRTLLKLSSLVLLWVGRRQPRMLMYSL